MATSGQRWLEAFWADPRAREQGWTDLCEARGSYGGVAWHQGLGVVRQLELCLGAREAARLDGVCSDDGLLECLAGLDDDEPSPAVTADDDVEALLREARQLGAAARADLAGADSKRDDVADLLSRAGDLVARAARDRGDSVEPSTDVPDYDDDSANDEPTDYSSEDEDDDR